MSRFFSAKYDGLEPYVPGEQPRKSQFIKLNTNESPFPAAPEAMRMAQEAVADLQLYSDPECRILTEMAARKLDVAEDQLIFTNGSDEILNYAFMAFCDGGRTAVFPDITYGFYKVFAAVNGVPYREIPLREDLSVNADDFIGLNQTVFIANPNAPTGLALGRDDIERIVRGNPNSVVVVDEAYVDFGGESAVPLIEKYENLLVTQTFSKSRSMAGARLGLGIGNADLIRDLNTLRFSTNPYNVNRMTMAAGVGALKEEEYFARNCRLICQTRDWAAEQLRSLGFELTDSKANFLFVRHPSIGGAALYQRLRDSGILVRHFEGERIRDYNRITVGSRGQMMALLAALKRILEEEK